MNEWIGDSDDDEEEDEDDDDIAMTATASSSAPTATATGSGDVREEAGALKSGVDEDTKEKNDEMDDADDDEEDDNAIDEFIDEDEIDDESDFDLPSEKVPRLARYENVDEFLDAIMENYSDDDDLSEKSMSLHCFNSIGLDVFFFERMK